MLYFDIFSLEFEKTVVIFEISTFKFVWNLKNNIVIFELAFLDLSYSKVWRKNENP